MLHSTNIARVSWFLRIVCLSCSSYISEAARLRARLPRDLIEPDGYAEIDSLMFGPIRRLEQRRHVSRDDVFAVGFLLVVAALIVRNGYRVFSVIRMYASFSRQRRTPMDLDKVDFSECSFGRYVMYHVGNWFTYSRFPGLWVLLEVFSWTIIIGTVIYVFLADHGVASSVYQIFVWLIAPDGGSSARGGWGGVVLGGIMSICGLLFFAMVMTILAQMFHDYVTGLKRGTEPVLESGHIVILGFTDDTIPLVKELCAAHEHVNGTTIAILSALPKPEVERRLDDNGLLVGSELKGSRVLVRTGFPHRPEDLELVSVDLCRTAIPMSDRTVDADHRDAYMVQVVSAVRSRDWPRGDGQVLVFYSVERNVELLREIGGCKASLVNLDRLLSSVCVSSSNQKHTASIISDLLTFEGSELYIAPVPDGFRGMTLGELEPYYPQCIIVGLIDEANVEDVEFCLDFDLPVEQGKDLVVLALDESSLSPRRKVLSPTPRMSTSAKVGHVKSDKALQEKILIMGWSHLVGSILVQLDHLLPNGTTVASFDDSDPDERKHSVERALKCHRKDVCENITIHYYKGHIGSSYSLQEAGSGNMSKDNVLESHESASPEDSMPFTRTNSVLVGASPVIKWELITRVFVLANMAQDPWRSDALCMTAAKQVQSLVSFDVPVVVEVLDHSSKDVCEHIGVGDSVCTATLPAQVMANLSLQPRLKGVFLQLLGGGYEIRVAPIAHYWKTHLPDQVCFSRLSAAVRASSGDTLIGWSIRETAAGTRGSWTHRASRGGNREDECPFVLNPLDKRRGVTLTDEVELVVIRHAGSVPRAED